MKNRYDNSNYRQQDDNDNNWRNRNQSNNEDRYRRGNFDYDAGQYGNYDSERANDEGRNYSSFRDTDQNRGSGNWYGRQYENQYDSDPSQQYRNRSNAYNSNNDFGSNDYDNYRSTDQNHSGRSRYNNPDRGWWDKTTDEVSSWFGDEDAKRRRRMDEIREDNHRGKGPKNYTRSSERIKEDVNDHLGDHWMLDASDIEVEVNGTEVTLTGTVNSKENKRRAEDIADSVSGVTHVQNNLRVTKGSGNNEITNDNSSKVSTSGNYKSSKETLNHN